MQTLDVLLYGVRVGSLTRSRRGECRLSYRADWLRDPHRMPISTSLPLRESPHSGRELEAFLDNLLPDSGDVRERWAVEAGLGTVEPFFLLAEYGRDVAGAIQFLKPDAPASESGRVLLSDSDIAQRIAAVREDDAAWRGNDASAGRFSLGGAQGKFSLAWDAAAWYEPTGDHASTHIFKPRVRRTRDGEVIEHLTMSAARSVELNAAVTAVLDFEGEHSLVVERFDRVRQENGRIVRLHQEDVLQALGYSRLQKYEAHAGPGYRRILALLGSAVPEERRHASLDAFVRALVFSWIVLNADAHAKNYSVFIRPDGIDLAPLYDLSSIIPYLGHEEEDEPRRLLERFERTNLSMRIAADFEAGKQSWFEWTAVAREAGLDRRALTHWATAVAEALPQILKDGAAALPRRLQSDVVARYVERMPLRAKQVLAEIRR